jgi:aspartyl protease family protein
VLVVGGFGFSEAHAQTVVLSGMMGTKALLVIDGSPPKSLGVGEVHREVKLVAVSPQQATVEVKGDRRVLFVGEAPVSVGKLASSANGNRIVLPLGQGGHFFAQGSINAKPVQFMVDTGATTVVISLEDAKRMSVNLDGAQAIKMSTANGVVSAWRVKLHSVRINEVEVFDVDAIVGLNMPVALLGNSFLGRFNMNRTSDTMVLERR